MELPMEESKLKGIEGRTSVINLGTNSDFEGIQGRRTSILSAGNLHIKNDPSSSQTDSGTERSDLTWDIIHKSGRDWTTSGHSEPTVKDTSESSCTESSRSSNSWVSSEESRSEEYQDKIENNTSC